MPIACRSFSSRGPLKLISFSFPSTHMSTQKSITSYFKATPPKTAKRPALSETNDSSPSKRTRSEMEKGDDMKKADGGGDVKRADSGDDKNLDVTAAAGPEKSAISADDALAAAIKRQAAVTPALSGNIGHSWFRALREEFSKKYFVSLSAYLDLERRNTTVFPPVEHVFSWTRHCDIKDVKVVILGQDPYHGPNQAHGLSFSVCRGVDQPPSLRNIFKELQSDMKGFCPPSHGDLTGWAKQGVLLLNAVLTVKAHTPNSHATRGWENLTDAVIKWLNRNSDHLVFLLWGAYAGKKSELIDAKKHLVLKSAHPSPLSASRGFFGCKHFSQANEFLTSKGKEPIDWKQLD